MEFIVAADSGTHVYRAHGLEKPTLLRSLPPAQAGNTNCLVTCKSRGCVAVLLQTGSVGIWDLASPGFACAGGGGGVGGSSSSTSNAAGRNLSVACEIAPQSIGPISRCYFSPKGNFLVAWEPLSGGSIQRLEQTGGDGSGKGGESDPAESSITESQTPGGVDSGSKEGDRKGGKTDEALQQQQKHKQQPQQRGAGVALTRAENLTVWSLTLRPPSAKEDFDVEVIKDGTHRLGVNVDRMDERSGLLIRRVDPGLVEEHNKQVQHDDPARLVLPGDRILGVNDKDSSVNKGANAQVLTEEIQRAPRLRLRVRRGPGWLWASAAARLFMPQISPLRWPPLVWSTDEEFAFRCVSEEIQVMDGKDLHQLRRVRVDSVSQMSVSPGGYSDVEEVSGALACFSPAGVSTAAPAMVRVFTEYGRTTKPVLTKSFFSDAAWVTMRWEPNFGSDMLLLVHSSELTEADVEGRTLHGQGGNGLYLLRAGEDAEPIASLSGCQDGMILDVQWCPTLRGEQRSLVALQGPQPALVMIFTYRKGGGVPRRVNLGRFGVRNSLRWDPHGCSFCLRVQSNRGAGVSSEADSIDLFDAPRDGSAVARRAGAAVGGRRDREQAISPAITVSDFSPDGRVLLIAVEAHFGAELKFLSVADGSALYRLKFDEVWAGQWFPVVQGKLPEPDFPPPLPEARLGVLASGAIVEVEIRDREAFRRRAKGIQARLKDIERLKSKAPQVFDSQQLAKLATEGELRESLAKLETEIQQLDQTDLTTVVFEVQTLLGAHTLECKATESCRDVARRFCRERRLDAQVAGALAERMEQRLQRPVVGSGDSALEAMNAQHQQAPARKRGPKPKVIDLGDKEAVRRRVRALQKKLREIDKLRLMPECALDGLQREKLANEEEVRRSYDSLARELDLLERLPRMVFDVETESGVRYIEFRDGDNCMSLAAHFIKEHNLEEDLLEPLAKHMEEKLRDQAILTP
eukprot:TRINITY_DN48256_c0_g1_i1.p1 TRINITY_DN48256_c0_g1~~TRINITY_DN48256_c0_g1_i1.p1  ORF type:complete len:972 (+),score=228.89 TRINITY_DN48256_c0_g1_i1:296-3211(+)